MRAVNCRSNHVHVVVTAAEHPEEIRDQFKAWCTRRLKQLERRRMADVLSIRARQHWWAERGSQRYINDEEGLEAAILYVRDGQDSPR